MDESIAIEHSIDPVYDCKSVILILGSFPSVKSRKSGFFYGNPQNRFWKVTASLLGKPVPESIEEKKAFLLSSRIALYDVIHSCRIKGSSDSTISDVVPADLSPIFGTAGIAAVFTNGKTAHALFSAYQKDILKREDICLPSTSPANASWQFEKLKEAWSLIVPYLNEENR